MSAVTHHFLSGSDMSELFTSGSLPIAGLHLMKDGGVQIFMTEPPLASPEALEDWNEACNVTDYLLYALENKKWVYQYFKEQQFVWEEAIESVKAREREELKASFQLIQGGRADEE